MKRYKIMTFTEIDKLKALAIVNIFETSRPFGDYAAYAVLNDGAGVSYGINQFTHSSGSLLAVIEKYLAAGGQIGSAVIRENLALLRTSSPKAIREAAGNGRLEKALKAAAATNEMRAAQHAVGFERYLRPAIEACEGSGFITPLALAVIYDSINHGSWEKIRDRVLLPAPTNDLNARLVFEKAWISQYVSKRHDWLRSVPRLRSTAYRTSFFLAQIDRRNWNLELPLFVHGATLALDHFQNAPAPTGASQTAPAANQPQNPSVSPNILPGPSMTSRLPARAAPAETPPASEEMVDAGSGGPLDRVHKKVDAAAAKYDQIETIVQTVLTRTDAAKSLWTTIAGTVWQSGWAVASFAIGLPGEVWFVVALIVAALMLFYLYRQFVFGRIRENSEARRTELHRH